MINLFIIHKNLYWFDFFKTRCIGKIKLKPIQLEVRALLVINNKFKHQNLFLEIFVCLFIYTFAMATHKNLKKYKNYSNGFTIHLYITYLPVCASRAKRINRKSIYSFYNSNFNLFFIVSMKYVWLTSQDNLFNVLSLSLFFSYKLIMSVKLRIKVWK